MDPNQFIRAYHLKKVDEQWHDSNSASWENLKEFVRREKEPRGSWNGFRLIRDSGWEASEQGYVGFRTQIKRG